ncbi:MAG: acetoin utilization protein AcuC, partial [Armatimonadota bacterium]
ENFKPQAIVTQLGADALHDDPITHWNLTTHSYLRAVQAFKGMGLPWVALGGGGYNVANVCRAWTLALATMLGVDLPNEVPDDWKPLGGKYGIYLDNLRDTEPTDSTPTVKADTERVIKWLKQNHPLLR